MSDIETSDTVHDIDADEEVQDVTILEDGLDEEPVIASSTRASTRSTCPKKT
jgi:hypothetical protein